jgi:hypothetical protein
MVACGSSVRHWRARYAQGASVIVHARTIVYTHILKPPNTCSYAGAGVLCVCVCVFDGALGSVGSDLLPRLPPPPQHTLLPPLTHPRALAQALDPTYKKVHLAYVQWELCVEVCGVELVNWQMGRRLHPCPALAAPHTPPPHLPISLLPSHLLPLACPRKAAKLPCCRGPTW